MTERAERAQRLHEQGYNCAQAVACAYCDQFGLDEETAYRVAEGFGLGMGLMEVCGALSAAFMLAGLRGSKGTEYPGATKGQTYKTTKALAMAFKEKNETYLCRELKGVTDGRVRRSCDGCIEDACNLIEQTLAE
ncbi:C-GCAxxG-C-C family protein [Agathobaculum sp. Marseille-P7918]|uniref:C-GCAxxG-C-C family protein n=1 Tax=Agathobaculum sp. Marseille-P7918 TaxID=2479843 RepID=UPI0035648013